MLYSDNSTYNRNFLFWFKSLPEGQKMFMDNLITYNKIEKGKRIGNGQFGEVFKGNNNLNIWLSKHCYNLISLCAASICNVYICYF